MTSDPNPPVAETAPADVGLTEYDRLHAATYLRLLDAASEDAAWDEVARVVLGLDPTADPAAARRTFESHLARARWISEHGFRNLLGRLH